MKLGLMGRLLPVMFSKVIYGYTAKAIPDIDIRKFRKKLMKEYKAMVARTPSVGSMKENIRWTGSSTSLMICQSRNTM